MFVEKKLSIVSVAVLVVLLLARAASAQTVWTKHDGNPVLEVGTEGTWDSKHLEPGSVFFSGADYHLWYSGYDGSHWKIGYATSSDGIVWAKHPDNPVFEADVAGTWDDGGVYRPSIVHDGEKYHMYYAGFGAYSKIGHATSDNGTSWARDPANPVLETGIGAQTWDSSNVYDPSVALVDGVFCMWYSAQGPNFEPAIGFAESADGTVWTKHTENPVLSPGEKEDFDASIFAPVVVFDNSTYHLWYHAWREEFHALNMGFHRLGYATSADGLTWEKYDGNPVLKQGRRLFLGWDGRGVQCPAVIYDADSSQYKMWYAGHGRFGKANHQQIGYAVSAVDGQ